MLTAMFFVHDIVRMATFYGDDIDGFRDGSTNFTDDEFVEASRIIKTLFEMDYVNIENPSIPYFMDGINLFKSGEGGFFIGPTIFDHVTEAMAVGREEIFGPVLSVIRYLDVEEAIAMANDIEFGLGYDDSENYGEVTVFSVFLYFYGGS